MKLYSIRGGVHPEPRKEATAVLPVQKLPLPEFLYIPVQQHIGAPADPRVKVGQKVKKGELLADSQGAISAPVHAPTSGKVAAIEDYPAAHPSGLPVRTIKIESDGENTWTDTTQGVNDPFSLDPDEIAKRVARAGIVGMGGAAFPAAVKLDLRKRFKLHTLVINGAECEPYLTCDDRVMRERSQDVIDGIRIMQYALGVPKVLIAIENNKPEAQECIRTAATAYEGIAVVGVPTQYPMGSGNHIVQVLTGQETPARALNAEIGVVVHNVGTALAVHEALRFGKPLIERVVTVTGGAIAKPKNLRIPLGSRVQDLIDFCDGFSEDPARLLSGGPMMGQALPSTIVPIIKGTNGILAMTEKETRQQVEMPCIRCGRCVNACPSGLVPVEMAAHARIGDFDGAMDYGLRDCIRCGSCAYVCPSHIPLVHYFDYAKGELTNRQRAKHKQEETKKLAELRQVRLEAQAKAKREALAQKKKEMAEKKKRAEANSAKAGA